MRTSTRAPGLLRAVRAFACVALATGTGCATLRATVSGYVKERNGITRSQQRLRDALADADYVKALAWHEDDALLQVMVRGIAAYYAGQFARSAAVLDTAALLADDRVIASLSKDALASSRTTWRARTSRGAPSACSFRTTRCSLTPASSNGRRPR